MTMSNSLDTKQIEYNCNGQIHQGYLSRPTQSDSTIPGIVVIHEWWGVNDYIRHRADMLAEQGFCALAIDMYGGGAVAESPDQAGQAMNAVLEDMETGTARLQAGYETLINQPGVDAEKTAAIGYCFGGAMALHMARMGMPLRAAVSFHGALGSFHKPRKGEVKANVLVCHGGDDAMVFMEDVGAFKVEMDDAGADYEVIVHQGAQHGFSSKEADENGRKYGIPVGYDALADEQSWSAMMALFSRQFA